MYAGQEIGMSEALIITVFSMTVVFLTLFVISLILTSFKTIFKVSVPAVKVAPIPTEDENIHAVIMAAIFEYENGRRVNPMVRITPMKRNSGVHAENPVARNCNR